MDKNSYYTRDEVLIHNTQDNIWIILNCSVLDLTKLVAGRKETMNDVSSYS